jgi:hypothetical protein
MNMTYYWAILMIVLVIAGILMGSLNLVVGAGLLAVAGKLS